MTVTFKLGRPQPKQREFMTATAKYVAFGGARGGGKSWAVREKAKRLAIKWPGIKMLIIRKTFVDLKDNHIMPLRAEIPPEIAKWKEMDRTFQFVNGSTLKCSYFQSDADALQYQGQEYDVIFLEEATQFMESVFNVLKACLRGANNRPKRIYLTCNPDGVGFAWVKRLFVSRDYTDGENPDDYLFIQSLVTDNQVLMEANPDYVAQLDSLPEDMRKRWRYGSWDVAEGQMFDDFDRRVHVIQPCPLDSSWRRYISIDYGLDRLAAYWYAIDREGYVYCYKEYCESNLIISKAAEKINEWSAGDDIYAVLAPPDLWSRSQETGKSKAELFYEAGLELTKASNDREAGWLAIKEMLRPDEHGIPKLRIFNTCKELIKCMIEILRDPKRPNDCSLEPHEITHACLAGNTLVNMADGTQARIEDLEGTSGKVISLLGEEQDYQACVCMGEKETIILTFDDGTELECTPDHLVLTSNRGWIPAGILTEEDDICQAEGNQVKTQRQS